jgi:Flp pilus assembly protein protease CpaA
VPFVFVLDAMGGRDVEYTATAGLVIGEVIVLWQATRLAAPAPAAPR